MASKRIYHREDLIWEAVRRNEEYIIFYEHALKENKIKEEDRYFICCGGLKWKMLEEYALDPNIDVDQIKDQIENGKNPYEVHPYYYLYNLGMGGKNVIEIQIPEIKKLPRRKEGVTHLRLNAKMRAFLRKMISVRKKRVLIAFDPTKKMKDINAEINKIRYKALLKIKQENEKMEGEGEFLCYPTQIKTYIEYLRHYDEMVTIIQNHQNGKDIEVKNGVIQIPKGMTYEDFVSSQKTDRIMVDEKSGKVGPGIKKPGDIYAITDRLQSYVERSYEAAASMIENAPRITFKATRTQKPKV